MVSPKITSIFVFLFILTFDHISATRPLDERQAPLIIIQSLPRGPVPPSAGNPCTNIPRRGHGRCTLTEMDVAGGGSRTGGVHGAPPMFSDMVLKFASAYSE
ncbi:hypothetical protein V6N13_020065 [Hibiscus sabdariffa]|uniref:Uncharacterized protein n=1 Tax=Hibiscus sabdariffa TaxID=183260 RepID=A0ABR2ESU5_9ROSI